MPNSPLHELVDPGWASALGPVESNIAQMGEFLRREVAHDLGYVPAGSEVFAAFRRPFAEVRVLIVGQDPYPTPGHAMGLSFSVPRDVAPLPRSLANIFRELSTDLGIVTPTRGDLSRWADQGVLLLNRVLTCEPGFPGSHRRKGWEAITGQAISALASRDKPLVAVLWGRDAEAMRPLLGQTLIITSAHPSPLSARRGFFGSRPFSRTNQLLRDQGAQPIDWSLP